MVRERTHFRAGAATANEASLSPPSLSLLRPLRLVLLACLPLTPVHGWKEWVWENASGTLEWPEAW